MVPTLNLLGIRVNLKYTVVCDYGNLLSQLRESYPNCTIDYYQSNIEGELSQQATGDRFLV